MSSPGVLALPEALTIPHAAALREQLQQALDTGTTVLELAAVAECDSAGLQLLLAAQHSARVAGQALVLAGASPAVAEVFTRCGLAHRLAGTPTEGT